MIKDCLNLSSILTGFESTLKIEYTKNADDDLISASISRIEEAYNMKLDKSIFELQVSTGLIQSSASSLLNDIMSGTKDLSFYIDNCMFNHSIGISLADCNYLGFDRPTLLTGLKYLQDKDLYTQKDTVIEPIRMALRNIETNSIKRLLVIMIVLDKLGVSECVSVIARYLYLGGLVA